mgnify:CR=1 FL=1
MERVCIGEEMTDTAIGLRLPADVLDRRTQLPLKVGSVSLEGSRIRLQPLDLDRDVEPLHEVSNGLPAELGARTIGRYDPDELIWRYMHAGPFPDAAALAAYLRKRVEAPDGLCFCVFYRATNRQVGVANYMNNAPDHLRIELGGIWYSPLVQGTGVNAEVTYLMLQHAFELGYRRVEWKCNARNERSRRAALRMGFRFEGTLDSYLIVKGCNRDSAWFRMLDVEWPAARGRLEELIKTRP